MASISLEGISCRALSSRVARSSLVIGRALSFSDFKEAIDGGSVLQPPSELDCAAAWLASAAPAATVPPCKKRRLDTILPPEPNIIGPETESTTKDGERSTKELIGRSAMISYSCCSRLGASV